MSKPQTKRAAVPQAKSEQTKTDKPRITARDLSEALRLNQVGDARLFMRLFEGRFAYDNSEGVWYRFDGVCWREDRARLRCSGITDELAGLFDDRSRRLGEILRGLEEKHEIRLAMMSKQETIKKGFIRLLGLAKRKAAYEKRASALRDITRIKKVLSLAGAGDNAMSLEGDEWNKHPAHLVCANAMIDLRTGKTQEPSPWDFMRMSSRVEWRGIHAECDGWMNFLEQAFEGNQELISYVQKLAGYWLTGLTNIQEFFCLWGPRGRNGKGVFFRTLRNIMGDFYTTMPVELLLDQGGARNSSGPRADLMNLRSKRLAVASESSKKARFSDAAIKMLSGGDPIPCRGVHEKYQIEYIPEFKMLFATNKIPSVDGGDQAFKQRLRVIPFYCQFLPGAEPDPKLKIYPQDPRLEDKLNTPEELSGILAWAVRGAVALLQDMTLTPPEVILRETEEYMDSQDTVGEFLEACIDITDGENGRKTAFAHIYAAFRHWCKTEKSMHPRYIPSHTVIGMELKSRPELQRVSPRNKVVYAAVIKPGCEAPEKVEGN